MKNKFKSIIACKFNGMAVHVLKRHVNDGAKIAIRGEVFRPKNLRRRGERDSTAMAKELRVCGFNA